jgi:hypothetical protein
MLILGADADMNLVLRYASIMRSLALMVGLIALAFVASGALRVQQITTTATGTKVVVQYTAGGHSSEFTTYTMRDRRRKESRNSVGKRNADGLMEYADPLANVSIGRCDLGQSFELNTYAREYTSAIYPPRLASEPLGEPTKWTNESTEAALPVTKHVKITTLNTGEHEKFFGHIARHVITTIKQTDLDSSHPTTTESTTDGWYIDLDQNISCKPKLSNGNKTHGYALLFVGKSTVPVGRSEYTYIGARERGFAVKEIQTSTSTAFPGVRNSSGSIYESEVTELVEEPLDPDLFEVPADFKYVEHIP